MAPLLPPAPDAEQRALLALLRQDARHRPEPDVDWLRLLRLATRHQVAHLAAERLSGGLAGELPEAAAAEARRIRRICSLRSMLQERLLAQSADAMAGIGIRPLVLKGPAVARLAYEAPELRAAHDIDLLVPAEWHENCRQALESAGLKVTRRLSASYHYHDVLQAPGGLVLELHWGLNRPDELFSLPVDEFLARGEPGRDGLPVSWSGPSELLLHTAAQEYVAGFASLHRIVDTDRLLRRCGQRMDWDWLRSRARRGRLAGALWLLLRQARDLLGTPLPAPADDLRPGPVSRYAVSSLQPARSLAGGFALRYTVLKHLYPVWLATGGRDRLRALVRLVREPTLRARRNGRSPLGGTPLPRLAMAFKVAAYQALCLGLGPFRRR